MTRPSPAEIEKCFHTCYQAGRTDVLIRLEQTVFGSDYGADGWTAVEQVDELAHHLQLTAGQRLLDLGSGRGWPGLYLALTSGCSAVLTDQSDEALRDAVVRARRDNLTDRVLAVPATAPMLPFQPGSFDAVVHTDVLCCLRPKASVLRETRRLLRPGGRTGFFVIHLAQGLTAAEHRAAAETGPPAVGTRGRDYLALLRSAGFVESVQIDVTARFASAHRDWLHHAGAFGDELAATEPPGAFADRVARRVAAVDLIAQGILRRSLFVARRPAEARQDP